MISKSSLVKLSITDEQREKTLDVLELSLEEAGQLIGQTSSKWCTEHLGLSSPVVYDCFYKVIVSYKIERLESSILKESIHA